MSKEIFNDLGLYLSGDIKLHEVCKKHGISKYQAQRKMEQIFDGHAGLPAYQKPRSKPHDLSIIQDQIAVERRVSAMTQACQGTQVTIEQFINSRLVKYNRIYGLD